MTERRAADLVEALQRLDEITWRLRRDCPWDRDQDERSIVPHTIEEAYELADAAHSGDDAKLLDELGDVLFQVMFLSMLLEERDAGSLAQVADHCREKLIRRHPHVFGEAAAETAGEVLELWGRVKRDSERDGEIFGSLPETLPATLYAKKVLRRAASAGYGENHAGEALAEVRRLVDEFWSPGWSSDEQAFEEVGRLLFHAVEVATAVGVDPEVALRERARAFKADIEASPDSSS